MHSALPPRKRSNPTPCAPSSPRSPFLRRRSLQSLAMVALGALSIVLLLVKLSASSTTATERIPPGTPPVVMVTVIEENRSNDFNEAIKQNRLDYASRHGYATFLPNASAYSLSPPLSWTKVPATRHALTLFPHSTWIFYLSPHALIANPALPLPSHLLAPARLEALMRPGVPVVPPDSVIRTLARLGGDRVDLVLTQDKDGLSADSFALRRGAWARYLLDVWSDPLYRSYNFQRAERHALEHVVQWHGTLLAKLALVPQRAMNAYSRASSAAAADDGAHEPGDFVVNFAGCERAGRDCEAEMRPSLERLRRREGEGGGGGEV